MANETNKVTNEALLTEVNKASGTNYTTKSVATMTNNQIEDVWGVLVDKYIGVKVFNSLDWDNPYDIFFRDKNTFAGILEMVSADIFGSKPYDEAESPYAVEKHDPSRSQFLLKELRRWKKSVSAQRIRRAFNTEYDLQTLLDLQVLKIEDSWRYENYVNVTADLSMIEITSVVGDIDFSTDATIKATTRTVYNKIQNLVSSMAKPSRDYNKQGNMGASKKGKLYLILRHEFKNIFDLEIVASIYNSSKIMLDNYFAKIITDVEMPNDNTVGYILDENAYMQIPHIKESEVKYGNLMIHQTLFYQDLRALVPYLNAVTLVKSATGNFITVGGKKMKQLTFDRKQTKITIENLTAKIKAVIKDKDEESDVVED